MKIKFRVLQRLSYTITAALLLAGVVVPALQPVTANAIQLASRSIALSDSGASGGAITSGVGSGTAVTYRVSFTTSASAQSLVIDFCSNDPIIGDSCGTVTGMNVNTPTLTGVTGNISSPGWNVTVLNNYSVELAKGSGSAAGAGAQVFDLAGITNPSTVGSFYARIYTYSNNTIGTYAGPDLIANAPGPGNYVDYGGIALSTNQVITVTARVQETLTFCVSGTNPADLTNPWVDCSDAHASDAPAVTLGHGTPTAVLDQSAVDTGTVYSQLSTNATTGAAITMHNSNTSCGGLSADGGTTCAIPAVNAGANTSLAISAGTAAFGLFVGTSSTNTGGTGSLTHVAPYATSGQYGMDTTTSSSTLGNVKTQLGSLVASTGAPCYRVDLPYTFGATASLTTPAGIYTANIDLVATGTF